MQKYECTVCDYIYDPEQGDPDSGIKPGLLLKISPMIGVVLSAALPSLILNRSKKKQPVDKESHKYFLIMSVGRSHNQKCFLS